MQISTNKLPEDIRLEAELTIPNGIEFNMDGKIIVWELRGVLVRPLAEMIYEEGVDEFFEEYTDTLATDIQLNGLRRPIVIGLGGIEGNHRIIAAYKSGIQVIPAYVARLGNSVVA